jgi:hypothetical protein
MNPFLWILWAFVALVFLFIAAAVVYTIVEKFRELPPKRTKGGVLR